MSALRDALSGDDAVAIHDKAAALGEKAAALARSAASSGATASAPAGDDGVVDADFTEIPDDERK